MPKVNKFSFVVRRLDNGFTVYARNRNPNESLLKALYADTQSTMTFEFLEEHKDKAPQEALNALMREIRDFIVSNGGLE